MGEVQKCIRSIFNHRIPIKLKSKFYRTDIKWAIFNGMECWAIKKQHVHELNVAKWEGKDESVDILGKIR